MAYNVEIIRKNFTNLGEGPHWDQAKQRLLLVDILESKIHRWDRATGKFADEIVLEGKPTVCMVLCLNIEQSRHFLLSFNQSHCVR